MFLLFHDEVAFSTVSSCATVCPYASLSACLSVRLSTRLYCLSVLFFPVLSYHLISLCHVPFLILSFPLRCQFVQFSSFLSCSALSYPALFWLVLPYLILCLITLRFEINGDAPDLHSPLPKHHYTQGLILQPCNV